MSNQRNPDDLKKNLTEMQFYVTQNHGTEPPFSGRLLHNKREGVYHCLVCDAPLFNSQTKYDSGCGWPSFYEPVSDDAIRYLTDTSHGMVRTEIRCGNCDAHLGHVFPDGPQPTGERFCVNSASMSFTDDENGVALTPEQKENSLQLVMLWQARHNTDAQHMTIDTNGQMVMKSKRELKEEFGIAPKPIATFK